MMSMLIFNRDNGMGTYHKPLPYNRTASLSLVRFIAYAFSASLRQTVFIHPAGTVSDQIFLTSKTEEIRGERWSSGCQQLNLANVLAMISSKPCSSSTPTPSTIAVTLAKSATNSATPNNFSVTLASPSFA
ncbi:hypothetical protein Fcan01_15385 [Folsomia candida]|uniref:Uncharacterized protein n=1 Tax=Folsomia candida TaxID=158441 RepID=A0A226DX17_FOLCA|nr:hypothetical protein Fcan01_15385 [Folsomia candida]